MNAPLEREIELRGGSSRVLEKGEGPVLGVFAGFGGLPRWTPFLDALAGERRVIAPALPGFPGGPPLSNLDDIADWISLSLDLYEAAGLEGADLIGISVGGALAAEIAAFARAAVARLVLVGPFGLYDDTEPTLDIFAQRPADLGRLLCARPERWAAHVACPEGEDELEWQVTRTRAHEAAARLLWPTGDLGLRKRLHRITAPTLLVWGAEDRIVPASYAKCFAEGISGPTRIRTLSGAGHLADLDEPEALAEAVLSFLAG